jgi:imidazolonepropionase-like amidohydrolase
MKTALTNVRVFDGRRLVPGGTVVIEDTLIGSDPAGARRVDGAGRVLLPGLIDAHVHITGSRQLTALADYGVTTALDMASVPEVTAPLRGLPGRADIRSACIPAIAPGSLHASFPGVGPAGLIGGPDEAKQFVADRVAEGADYIKIVIGSPFADHEQATIDALVAAAHERGKLVVAHASSADAVAKAQAAGADVLTHAPLDQPMSRAAVALAVAAGRAAVPTLTMMEAIASHLAPPGADYASAKASVAALHEAGVPILAGTDANDSPLIPGGVPHGQSLHRELELLTGAGLSTVDALRAATVVPATVFGLADRGVIEPGKRADLVLLDDDPLADIRASRSIRRVWIGGVEAGPAGEAGQTAG